MTLEKPHRLSGRCEPFLRRGPGLRRVFTAPQIADGHGHVVCTERLRHQRGMIVMMADVAQEDGTVGDVGELAGFLQRNGVFRYPPRIEMTAVVATKAGSAPTAVNA